MNGASVTPKGLDQFRSLTSEDFSDMYYVTQQLQPRRCHLPRLLHHPALPAPLTCRSRP